VPQKQNSATADVRPKQVCEHIYQQQIGLDFHFYWQLEPVNDNFSAVLNLTLVIERNI